MISGNLLEETLPLPFVSVIIPVYDDSQRLRACLRSLRAQTYPASGYEVIVVDNASREDIQRVVDEAGGVVYAHEGTRGPAAARNKGVSLAKGEVIAFSDSDCLPSPDWLEKGVRALTAAPGCGVVGGDIRLYFQDPGRPTAVELNDMRHFRQKHYVEHAHFSATANLFTFKKVFADAGSFDESFDLPAYEDREWCDRVFSKGYPIVYAPDAIVRHPARRTLPELCRKTVASRIGRYHYSQKAESFDPPSLLHALRLLNSQPELRGFRRKLGVCAVMAYVCSVEAAAQVLLTWTGGRWRPAR